MRRRLAAQLLAALALAGGGVSGAAAMKKPRHTTVMPLPRDGDVAIREELEAARRAGTIEAYDLFLQRHAGHPLAAVAHRERDELALRQK